MTRADEHLLLLLFLTILVGTGVLVLFPPRESYTEFFILGTEGKAGGYPTKLKLGEEGRVLVGAANHEQRRADYTFIGKLNDTKILEKVYTLDDGQEEIEEVDFKPSEKGRVKLEFLLYKGRVAEEPYRSLHLYVVVE